MIWFERSKSLKEIIFIDVNWLCHKIIGPILDPQLKIPNTFSNSECKPGIIKSTTLKCLFPNEDVDVVIELFKNLKLCFETTENGEYLKKNSDDDNNNNNDSNNNNDTTKENRYFLFPIFLPSLNQENNSQNANIEWKKNCGQHKHFYGRRFVADQVSSFSAGFFPKLQVYFCEFFSTHVKLWRDQIFGVVDEVQFKIEIYGADLLDVFVRGINSNVDGSTVLKFIHHVRYCLFLLSLLYFSFIFLFIFIGLCENI